MRAIVTAYLRISDAVVIVRLTQQQNTFSGVSYSSPLTLDHWRRTLTFTTDFRQLLELPTWTRIRQELSSTALSSRWFFHEPLAYYSQPRLIFFEFKAFGRFVCPSLADWQVLEPWVIWFSPAIFSSLWHGLLGLRSCSGSAGDGIAWGRWCRSWVFLKGNLYLLHAMLLPIPYPSSTKLRCLQRLPRSKL